MAHEASSSYGTGADEGACIQVHIPDQPSLFLPHRDLRCPELSHNGNATSTSCDHCRLASPTDTSAAPEKELIMCAIQLAVLEKVASGLGALGFVWATVVLLGGFAITLQWKDFGFVSVTLLIEGTRIFSRSHELELRHQSTWYDGICIDEMIQYFHEINYHIKPHNN